MIARIWKGNTLTEKAAEYRTRLEGNWLEGFRRAPGNRGALVLQREDRGTAEFVVVSFWEDFDAIRRFAGPAPEKAVYDREDDRYLLGKEPEVVHYEIAAGAAPIAVGPERVARIA